MPEQHFGNVEGVPDEEFFRVLERSKPYKDMQRLIKKALEEQWNDILLSGIINIIFNNYKTFFVKPRGKKVKIKKNFKKADEDNVKSEKDLKELEKEKLQGDKFMVGENAIKMVPFLLFLRKNVDKSSKSIASYYNFKKEFRDYLKQTANKAGQTIIDQIPTPKPIKFRLSNKALKKKIAERVDKLVKGLDDVTRKTLTKQLAQGIKLGETKTQMMKRLQKKGLDVAKTRAKRIIATETEAIAEFIRFETARMNGVTTKTWETAQDERVCPICLPLNGKTVPINKPFPDVGVMYPPAHVMCRCSSHYNVESRLAENFIKGRGLKILEYLTKKKKQQMLYTPTSKVLTGIVNPNAVWAGGESLVGPDKKITEIYEEIKEARPIHKELLLEEAETKLSIEGMVQLRNKLGLSPNVKRKDFNN